jgi:hypothetical protein
VDFGLDGCTGNLELSISVFSEAYRVTAPEGKRRGHDVQDPPASGKPLESFHN